MMKQKQQRREIMETYAERFEKANYNILDTYTGADGGE
jgi:hypothetical protein